MVPSYFCCKWTLVSCTSFWEFYAFHLLFIYWTFSKYACCLLHWFIHNFTVLYVQCLAIVCLSIGLCSYVRSDLPRFDSKTRYFLLSTIFFKLNFVISDWSVKVLVLVLNLDSSLKIWIIFYGRHMDGFELYFVILFSQFLQNFNVCNLFNIFSIFLYL